VIENALMNDKDVQCQTSFEPVNTRELVEGIYIVSKNKTDNRGNDSSINISVISNKDIQSSTIDNSSEQTNNSD
jgi:hypothetical protein